MSEQASQRASIYVVSLVCAFKSLTFVVVLYLKHLLRYIFVYGYTSLQLNVNTHRQP